MSEASDIVNAREVVADCRDTITEARAAIGRLEALIAGKMRQSFAAQRYILDRELEIVQASQTDR